MAVLRNVPKTFSFEEQRIEINEIAQDLFDLSSANANLTVNQGNPGTASLSYDPSTGILTYIPPDFTGYLTTQTVYSVEALLSPGIQLLDDGNAQASNRVFFDGLDGVSIARKSGTTNTIEFSVSLDINDLGDVDTTGAAAPADGEALVWDQTAGKWKAEQLLMVNVNQFSVENTGTAGNGAGHLDYNQSTGLFTFSPATIPAAQVNSDWNATSGVEQILNKPTLFDGDYNSLSNLPTIPTNNNLLTNGAGYITGIGTFGIGALSDVDTTTNPPANDKVLKFNGTNWVPGDASVVANLNDLSDVDTTGAANGKILKHDGTSWIIGDDSVGTTITALNDIGDVNVGGTITDGHVLKWDNANSEWVAGPDLTTSGGTGIALTDLSVLKPNPAASGSGDVTYSSTSGAFTYTPPELFSKSYNDLTDKPTLFSGSYNDLTNKPTIPTNNNELTNGAGYITSYTDTTYAIDLIQSGNTPVADEFKLQLTGSGGGTDVISFKAGTDIEFDNLNANGSEITINYTGSGGGGAGVALTDFSVVKPNPSASGGGDVTYDNTTGEFTYTPPSIPAAQVQSDWNASTGLGEILNKPTLFSGSYTDLTNKPTLFSGSYNDLTNKPTIPATLDNLTDVSLGTVSEGKILKYTSGSWSAEDAGSSGSSTLSGLTDTSISGSITTGHVLKWDGSSWGPAPDLQGSGGSGIALTDLSVTKPNPSASGSGDVTYNSTSGAFTYTPPEIFSGSYSDLTNKPTLFSGSYNDLTNKPTIPAAQIQADWDQTTTTALDYIKNKPTIGSGTVTSITAGSGLQSSTGGAITTTGTIQLNATLENLNDVSLGTVSEGKILKYTSGSWSAADESSGGSGEQNVQVDWNESNTSDDAYIKNKPTLFSGSYTDLTNKPTLFSGSYNDLSNKPTIPAAQIQVDWSQSNTTSLDYIKNKPTIPTVPTNVSSFTNDAGYLTSIGTISLDDLDGVSTSGVGNGQVLKYNGTSWAPAADTNYPTGGIGALTDVNWDGGGSPGTNDILQYNGSTWTNAPIPSGVPSGTIVMYNSGSAPSGWAICNGSNGTPDLRGRFIVGSGGNISGTGGSADAVLIQHSHEYNFSNAGAHSHTSGNMNTSNTGSHTHGQGNFSTNNTGSHSHTQSGSGSGNTGVQSHNHYHTTSQNITIGGGSHAHTWTYTNYDDSNAAGLDIHYTTEGGNYANHTTNNASHNHNFNFTLDTMGVSQDHTHSFNFNIGGNTGNAGGHSHNVTGNTGTNGDHSHSVSGNTSNTGSHGHSFTLGDVSGQHSSVTVSSGNAPGTNKNLPPYYTLTYIMKL